MATNITKEELDHKLFTNGMAPEDLSSPPVWKGNVEGNVKGNADTATALAHNFNLSIQGDATGITTLNAQDAVLTLHITEAEHAVNADHAKQTQECAHASLADLANIATLARTSEHSKTTVQAERDSEGHVIKDTYMTITKGATKDELLKTVTLRGKAQGTGNVIGTTVTVDVTAIEDTRVKFRFVDALPADAKVDDVYLNPAQGHMWIHNGNAWQDVFVKITGDISNLKNDLTATNTNFDSKLKSEINKAKTELSSKIDAVKTQADTNKSTIAQLQTTMQESYMTIAKGATKDELLKTIVLAGKAQGTGTVKGTKVVIDVTAVEGTGSSGEAQGGVKFKFVTELPLDAMTSYVYVSPTTGKMWVHDGSKWQDILVKITGDISKLQKTVSDNATAIDNKLTSSIASAKSELTTKIDAAKSELTNSINTVKGQADANKNTIAQVKTTLDSVSSLTNKNKSDLQATNTKVNQNTQAIQTANTKIEENKQALQATNTKVEANKQELQTTNTLVEANKQAIQKIQSDGIGNGYEIGDIGICVFPIDENQLKRRLLNGSTILTSQYPDFLKKLKAAISKSPTLGCTEEQWQAIATASPLGQCGKFVVDEAKGTIRLPKIINPINNLTDLSSLGELSQAGLPNIKGEVENHNETTVFYRNGKYRGAFNYKNADNFRAYTGAQGGASPNGAILTFNANKSNSIYGNSPTVRLESPQYPYFIQLASSVKEKAPAEKELTLNNPYSLLEHKIVDCKLNNASWLRSEGQFNSGDVYTAAYDLLVAEKAKPTRGFSVKLMSETYTDYDFVLDTTTKQFRLPLFISGRQLIEKKEPTAEDSTWYNLYSDGWLEQGGVLDVQVDGWRKTTVMLSKTFRDTYYSIAISGISYWRDNNSVGCLHEKTTGYFVHDFWQDSQMADKSMRPCWLACGYAQTKPAKASNLYFYVGDTVQNANLINAGRIEEKLLDLELSVDDKLANFKPNQETVFKNIVPDYSAGVSLSSSNTTYTVAFDGWLHGVVYTRYFNGGTELHSTSLAINSVEMVTSGDEDNLEYYSSYVCKGDVLSLHGDNGYPPKPAAFNQGASFTLYPLRTIANA